MIRSFASDWVKDIFAGVDSRPARRVCPRTLWTVARRKLDRLNAAETLAGLRVPPGNHLEALKGDRKGHHSIRINDQFRLCFVWTDDGPTDVDIVDYH